MQVYAHRASARVARHASRPVCTPPLLPGVATAHKASRTVLPLLPHGIAAPQMLPLHKRARRTHPDALGCRVMRVGLAPGSHAAPPALYTHLQCCQASPLNTGRPARCCRPLCMHGTAAPRVLLGIATAHKASPLVPHGAAAPSARQRRCSSIAALDVQRVQLSRTVSPLLTHRRSLRAAYTA